MGHRDASTDMVKPFSTISLTPLPHTQESFILFFNNSLTAEITITGAVLNLL